MARHFVAHTKLQIGHERKQGLANLQLVSIQHTYGSSVPQAAATADMIFSISVNGRKFHNAMTIRLTMIFVTAPHNPHFFMYAVLS
jgi:hypothetical protein